MVDTDIVEVEFVIKLDLSNYKYINTELDINDLFKLNRIIKNVLKSYRKRKNPPSLSSFATSTVKALIPETAYFALPPKIHNIVQNEQVYNVGPITITKQFTYFDSGNVLYAVETQKCKYLFDAFNDSFEFRV